MMGFAERSNADLWHASRPRPGAVLTFGRYEVELRARRLLRDGRAIALGSRAFDVLIALLSARGRVVPKRDIMRTVWPDTQVDESNLRFQIAALRHALEDHRDYIKTISGRGYFFVDDRLTEDEAP